MHFKVIVIGAGLAGLSALGRLNECGITKTLVLEARKDIGGRVRTINFAGSQFNIGPEWLHGQQSNPLYRLATTTLNLQTRDCNEYSYFFSGPLTRSIDEREALFRYKLTSLQEAVDQKLMTQTIHSLQGRSIEDVLNLSNRIQIDDRFDRFAQYWAFNFENGSAASDYSALVYRLSSKIFENVPAFSDYYFPERNGFSKIIDYFGKCANLNEDNASFNDPVARIDLQEDRVYVTTESAQRYSCDFCICTAPISLLRNRTISIFPDFGNKFHSLFKKIPFSTYTRVFAELSCDTVIPDFDWLVDIESDCKETIALWQNPRNEIPVLIAHVCLPKTELKSDLTEMVERSLRRILRDKFKSVLNVKVVSLVNCRFSHGAFPCAAVDFDNEDVDNLCRLGDDSRLQFAGDSYNLDYFGTVQGAVASGIQAADSIRDSLRDDVLTYNMP